MLFTGNYLEASKLLSNFHGSYQATIDAKQLYELVCGLSAILIPGMINALICG